jgi:hypothetical protein
MPTRLSTYVGRTREEFENLGVYDTMIDFDSKLHIDAPLVFKTLIPEFNKAKEKITDYFKDVIRLLKHSNGKDVMWRTAVNKLTFGEGLNTGLGYSNKGVAGSGIGREMAVKIATTITEIIGAGIEDPTIFELVPVFEKGIGPDRISDMMSFILKEEFSAYTKRISEELKIEAPFVNNKPIVFVPKSFLNDLPIAEQWEDVAVAALYNEQIRNVMSSLLGISWKQIANDFTKAQLKKMFIENPALLTELLAKYKLRNAKSYDFVLDHIGILLWDLVGPEYAESFNINLSLSANPSSANVLEVLLLICNQYKNLIENNGLVEHLYDANGKKRPERFPQLLFFAIADSYCKSNNLDLNREINAGSGSLDFKTSQGLAKANLEIKYSSNPNLVDGFEEQLTTYNRAEGVDDKNSIYMILRVNERNDSKIKLINETIAERIRLRQPTPTLVVIDAIIKPSASKRKRKKIE